MPKKHYSKTGNVCRVTFQLPPEVTAKKVSLCGNFNEWDPKIHPMKKLKDGRWSITISLKSGDTYRFKYLIDNRLWENDWSADNYRPNPFGTEDSIIRI